MAIDVKTENFEKQVIQESYTRPVMVDFWANWCNPCKVLGPILEKAEEESNGRFLLVRIDTQTETQLAAKFKISSIPFVVFIENGKIKDQFVGALSPEQVNVFLNKNLPHPELKNALSLFEENKFEEAADVILKNSIKGDDAEGILWNVTRQLLQSGKNITELKKYIDAFSDYGGKYSDAKLKFHAFYKNTTDNESLQTLSRILQPEQSRPALEYFLDKIISTKSDERENYKNALFCCFLLLEDSPLVPEYRRKLSSALF